MLYLGSCVASQNMESEKSAFEARNTWSDLKSIEAFFFVFVF